MVTEASGFTGKIVELALDGLMMRQQAISQNIANIGTQGYRPVNVSFENQLMGFVDSGFSTNMKWRNYQLQPQISHDMPNASSYNRSDLDLNVVMLNQNNLQYQALIKGLQKYGAAVSSAVMEGRR